MMKQIRNLIVGISLATIALLSMGQVISDMNAAKDLGNTKGLDLFNGIKTPPSNNSVPGYTGASQSQQSYYQAGNGNLLGPGVGRAAGCNSQADTECQAVNLIQWGPNNRPKPTFNAADPLISNAKAKLKNPSAVVGSFATPSGSSASLLTQNISQCHPVTTTTPATYQDQICDEASQFETSVCALQRVVTVSAEYDYSCQKASQSKSDRVCNKTLNVECGGAPPIYSCPDGSTPLLGTCSTTSYQSETATVKEYTCPAGQTVSGSNCVSTTTIDASPSYSCPVGAALSGTTCLTTITNSVAASVSSYICPAETTVNGSECLSTLSQAATVDSYTCPPGSSISGSSCLTTNITNATPIYSCPVGATLSGSNCVSPTNQILPATIDSYTCPSGGLLQGTSCLITSSTNATPLFVCSDGYTLEGSMCTKNVKTNATPVYTCQTGVLSGSACLITSTSSTAASITYSCASPFTLSNSSCVKQDYQPATPQYSCSAGYTLSGTTCFKTLSTPVTSYGCPKFVNDFNIDLWGYPWPSMWVEGYYATPPVSQYILVCLIMVPSEWHDNEGNVSLPSQFLTPPAFVIKADGDSYDNAAWYPIGICPAGTTLVGDSCQQTISAAAVFSEYKCPTGQTVSGSSCIITTTVSPSVSYSCPPGASLSGGNCITTTTTSLPASVANYICPAGSTVSESECLSTVTQAATIASYTCPTGSSVSGSSCLTTNSSNATPVYSCPDGGTLSGSNCVSPTNQITPAIIDSHTCPTGSVLSGSLCLSTASSDATPVYKCSEGYILSDTTCRRKVSDATPVYNCSIGVLEGSNCNITTTTTVDATESYVCAAPYTLSGSKCVKQDSSPATPQYACKDGGTLSGATCTYPFTTTTNADASYSCDTGDLTPGPLQQGVKTFMCCSESINNNCQTLEALAK